MLLWTASALLQDPSTPDLGKSPVSGQWLAWILIIVIVAALAAAAFFIGRFWGRFVAGRSFAADRERMFNIEKSLQEFFETDRKRLETDKTALAQQVDLLTKKNDEYKRKAAGVGVMGMGKDRKAELLLELMAENEALEEKLFEQNLKLKEERDDHLQRELQHISVKRVLLSEILQEDTVRDSIRAVLADEGRLKRLSLDRKPPPAEQIVEGSGRVVDQAQGGGDHRAAPAGADAATRAEAGQAPPA